METKKLCVIGDPVEHSLSPVIHNAVLKQTGLPYVYGRVRVRDGETAAFLCRAAEEGYAGFNATMPHKTDLVELVDDAMGDDYAKLGGLTSEEDLREPAAVSMRKRLPWLIVLLFLGMGVSSVVGIFESVVAVLPIVICFQSLVLDMAGNVGTQSLAVTIRVLMDENLTLKEELALLGKEMRVGLLNGGCLGLMALAVLGVYIHVCKGYAWGPAFLISGCVGVSLVVAMVISSLVGTMVPMLFHKIHIDPAVASGPLITTVNDLVAVVTYYGLALLFLVNVFHL